MEADSEVAMLKWSQLTSRLQRHTLRGVRAALAAHSGAPTAALRHGDGTAHFDASCGRAPNFTCYPGGDKDVSCLGAGDSELLAKFLTEEEADQAFKALCPGGEIEYQQWYHMPDKKKPYQPLKRLQRVKVAMADPQEKGLPWYRFPVNDQQRYGILPMSPTVRMLCDRVNQRLNGSFNHVVVLYYADGNECIGYHKDKTLDLDENSSIVSISLGRPGRPYVLRDGIFNPTTEMEVLLPHGGLFRLGPETNRTFYHAVRQTETPENAGARVSITFRHVTSYETAGTLTGKGAEFPTLNWPLQLNGQHRFDEDLDQALERPESATVPKAPVSKKVAGARLSPADVDLLRMCLAEASLEDFFIANDLKGAGLAARAVMLEKVGEARGAELSKALGSRIGEAYHAWKKAARAKPAPPEPSAVPAPPLELQATTPATANALPAEPAWSLGGLLSRWIWGEPDPTPEELLTYWFGVEPYKFRGGLWWRGIDPASPLDGQEGTDQRILNKYGTLIRSCENGLANSKVASWADTPEGKAALVVLLDQMPRNAFRGTAEMFAYDALAQEMASKLLQCEQVPWPHATFAHVALMHSEDVATVEASALGLLRLASEVEPHVANRLKSMHNEAKTHCSVLHSFGRYPHRNELLGRESSAAELSWLRSKNLPTWAQSVRPKFQKKLEGTSQEVQKKPDLVAQPSGPKLRILVLHSNRQNASDFKRKTRGPLEPLEAVADLHYLDGPHAYTPMGEAHDSVGKIGVNAPKNRCWWNATDDPSTMRYVGMEKTLEHVENAFREHGPFDGVMGFSQGGCLAGLLAALQPRGHIKFDFCVVISGFYCRDVEYCKLLLDGVPKNHRKEDVHAKGGAITMPSFHSWGLQDQLVEPWRSEKLADCFKDPLLLPHKADHFAQGRLHWPIDLIVKWLKETGLTKLAEARPQEVLKQDKTAWARLMKGSGVAGVRQEDVQEVMAEALDSKSLQQLLDRALALLPWNSKVAQPLAAYWIILAVAADPNYTEDPASILQALVAAGGWKSLVHLHSILEEQESSQCSEAMQTAIVEFFGKQLSEDATVVRDWRASEDDHRALGMQPAVSQCARHAPRFGGAVRKLALRVAADIHCRSGGQLVDDIRQQQPELSVMYRKLLSDVIGLLDEFSEAGLAHQKGDRRSQWRLGGLDDKTFAELRASPLSDAVVHPEPQPVDISSEEEMMPLYSFLRSGEDFQPNVNDDLVFTKGTITRDKRLDLCKQVIGPQGVEDLMQALFVNQGAGLVQHLLLGNNVCGNTLPHRIADLISEGKVSLNTWYIAGNRITAEGLKPLCDVLRDDTTVHQLWLKRNPLHKEGAVVLAEMLRNNRTLQVLDLVNCGLMDEGAEALLQGLEGSSLKHVYLDGNGLTAKTAGAITKAGVRLETLSLGMNRLYDEGTAAVAENLSPSVRRLCLAAVGMGVPGAQAVGDLLKKNSTLRFLDLGLLKATGALKEVPNRITDEGTQLIAAALEQNTSLNAMLLVHNTIHQAGIKALQVAISKHPSIVKIELEQLGIPYNELTREEIRHTLATNRRKLQEDPVEWAQVREALDPKHLEEIKSVYRMGNTYSPGANDDPDLW